MVVIMTYYTDAAKDKPTPPSPWRNWVKIMGIEA
jgi:hypothetical protein